MSLHLKTRHLVPGLPVFDELIDAYASVGIVWCFAHVVWSSADLDIYFGAATRHERMIRFDDGATMAHIMHWAGSFSSVSDARRNGWDKPIPPGWQQGFTPKQLMCGDGNVLACDAARFGKGDKVRLIWVLGKPVLAS